MKRFIIIGFALMLTAFTLEGKEAVIEIDEEETKTHKEAGRILYKYTMVNDVVNTFVEAYVNREMDERMRRGKFHIIRLRHSKYNRHYSIL